MDDKETPLDAVLATFLQDDQLKDVTLQGTDGVQVRANKYVLASRSKVFRQMLLGGFSEAERDVIELEYEGKVLQAVVEYIHTDSAHILNLKKRKEQEDETRDGSISTLVSLSAAAGFYNLPGLCNKVYDILKSTTEEEPALAFQLLAASRAEGPNVDSDLADLALTMVRQRGRTH
ncbi:MAG: hypothetical protein SGARI_002551, partial [Bacillariaceae sp.]